MTTKFRAYAEGELAHIEFRTSKNEAFMDATARLTAELGTNPDKPDILIEEVRDATLSDFFDFRQLVSLMSENMVEKIGNDDAFTDDAIAKLNSVIGIEIGSALDDAAESTEFRIDGFIVINRWRVTRWWVRDNGEAE